MINRDLIKKIQQILSTHPPTLHPKLDEQQIIDKITNSNSLRLTKSAIKCGVIQYFKSKPLPKNQLVDIQQLSKPKKKIKKTQIQFEFQDHPSYQFQNMGAIQQVLASIKNYIFTPIQRKNQLIKLGITPFKGYLIIGAIGSGKTLLSNCILSYMKNILKFNAYSLHASSLLSSDSQQNIKKLFQTLKQTQPSIILIDDIDIICSKQSSKRPQGSPILPLTLQIQKIKQNNIYLIATTSNQQKLDISLKKLNRFDKSITINTNNDQSRYQIIRKLLNNIQHNLTSQQMLQLAKCTSGFMAADLVMLLKQSGLDILSSSKKSPIVLTLDNLTHSLKYIQPILKKQGFSDIPSTTLDDIGGLKSIKAQLQRQIIIPIKQQYKFKLLNFDIQSGGVLLYGPPGCGKTMLAKAIANAVRANFIIVKGPQLLNKYVGQSQQAVRQVFNRAQRASPCVIFFDQFDAIAPKRSDQGNQVTERVVNTLLTALDGVEQRKMVFVIAATNRKDMVDQAVLRAGRIQKHLYVPQPTQEQRIQILKAITKKMKISNLIQFTQISKKAKGFSGADLKYLIKQATITAVIQNRSQVIENDINIALTIILQQKQKNKYNQKIHELQLKNNQQNQFYTYHYHSQKNINQVQIDKKYYKKKYKSNLMEEFLQFLNFKLSKS